MGLRIIKMVIYGVLVKIYCNWRKGIGNSICIEEEVDISVWESYVLKI